MDRVVSVLLETSVGRPVSIGFIGDFCEGPQTSLRRTCLGPDVDEKNERSEDLTPSLRATWTR